MKLMLEGNDGEGVWGVWGGMVDLCLIGMVERMVCINNKESV